MSQCTTGKNEVTLEFHQNDDAEVSLMEVRFYVPPTQEDGVDPVEVRPPVLLSGLGQPAAGSLQLDDPRVPRQAFAQNVLSKADVIQATGDAICIFRELQCLTPRGRYDIRIYPTFLHLHGKTFDYKIPYTTVLRLFLLPHKDQRQMFFVVSRNPRTCDPGACPGLWEVCVTPVCLVHWLVLVDPWLVLNPVGPSPADQPGPPHQAGPDPLPLPHPPLLEGRGHLSDAQHERVSEAVPGLGGGQWVGGRPQCPRLHLAVFREEVEKRFEGRLTKNMSGSLYEMVSRVMKALVNRKITVPGNFQG